MYCSICGKENMNDIEECIYCGSKLKTKKEIVELEFSNETEEVNLEDTKGKKVDLIDKYMMFCLNPDNFLIKRAYTISGLKVNFLLGNIMTIIGNVVFIVLICLFGGLL